MATQELSLDKIRLAEARQAKELARLADEKRGLIAEARERSEQCLQAARENGRKLGEWQRKEILSEAQTAAETIHQKALLEIEKIQARKETWFPQAVEMALSILLGRSEL